MAKIRTVAEIEALSRNAEVLSDSYEKAQSVVLTLTGELSKTN